MKYFDELKKSMEWLGAQPDTIFIGQAVKYPGTAITNTLSNIDPSKLIELPVAEEMQMGMTLGISLNNTVPISIFPRWNFLILGTNQLVNHIDKIKVMSDGKIRPKIIIVTAIGSQRPLHPQYQHVSDFTDAFKLMCGNVDIIKLDEPEQIFDSFQKSYLRDDGVPTLLVQWGDYYNEK
jgi:pyruvate/2-oxoglutarate/acetoin dehydrogenase E1 component